ncbi:IS30 family transposase [Sulfurimonas sp. SAG-AH-194-C21]|nr:IS30 family transposase [Sulfurimonas sp. SAG-AH-194-C21]MDF1883056.1 IS30 family transposase [Sulfurimonas sp. SAG-AH-194-C21]
MKYKQLTLEKRYHILALIKAGLNQKEIAVELCVHPATINRYIYTNKKNGGKLYQYLRHKNKKYHKRSNDYMAKGTIIDRIMINQRPKIVEKKSRIGDWEIDTVVGKDHKGFLVTVVDRKSKFSIIKCTN